MKFQSLGIKACCLLFIMLNTFLVGAQSVQELQYLISQPELTKKEKINILYTLSRELTYVDNIKSLEYAEEALQLATEVNDIDGIAYSYRILSSIYALNDNYFMSMEYIQKAIDIFENRGDEKGIANCYISLGHIYRSLNNHDLEIKFHKKSFEVFKKQGIAERIGVSAHNLGESYYNNKEFAKAENLTRLAIQINDSILNLPVLSSCYKVMGLIKEYEKQLDSASYYFKKVIKISDELGDDAQKIATVEAMIHLATMAKSAKNYNLEYKNLQQAEAFCEKFNLKKLLLKVYHEMQTFYLDQNNLEKVRFYLNEYDELAGDLQRVQLEDRNRLTESMTSIHQLNKTTEKLHKKNAAQASSIFYRNISLYITSFFLIALFVVLRKLKYINRELKSQNDIINEQKSELHELNATKNKFFSIVAHDLRSPLASLKSFSSVLVEHIDFISKEEIQSMGEKLNTSLDNTLKMADNLIIWAQSQMNIIEDKKENINIREVVNEICDIFKVIASNKEVRLIASVMGDPHFIGDKDQVEFVIRNLINNAIKFTPRKGIVNVSVTQTSNQIKISVSDTGVGMSSEFSKNLFSIEKPKGIPGTEGEKGSGLGLVLSSEFVKRNEGEIHVVSQEAIGTTITVSFSSGRKTA
tara:strand:- start:190 stop:2109 length:1920 start_codon:yes stop_codon:yes gene_type:complete